jgi:hypothetical protein
MLFALVTSNPGAAQWLFAAAALVAVIGVLAVPWARAKPSFVALAFVAAFVVLAAISIGLLVAF